MVCVDIKIMMMLEHRNIKQNFSDDFVKKRQLIASLLFEHQHYTPGHRISKDKLNGDVISHWIQSVQTVRM